MSAAPISQEAHSSLARIDVASAVSATRVPLAAKVAYSAFVAVCAIVMFARPAKAVGLDDDLGTWTISVDFAGIAQLARLAITDDGGTLHAALRSEFGVAQSEDVRIEDGALTLTFGVSVGGRPDKMRVSLWPKEGALSGRVVTGEGKMISQWPVTAAKVGTEEEAALRDEHAAEQGASIGIGGALPVADAEGFLGAWDLTVKRSNRDNARQMRMELIVRGVGGNTVVGVKAMNGPLRTFHNVSKTENGLSWVYELNFGDTTVPFRMNVSRTGEELQIALTSGDGPPFLSGTGIRKENGDELERELDVITLDPHLELIGRIDAEARVVEVKEGVFFVQEGNTLTAIAETTPLLVRTTIGRLPDRCLVASVQGSLARVVNAGKVEILDLSDPNRTHVIGSCDVPGNQPTVIRADGSLIYFTNWNGAADTQQLHAIDVSDSTDPVVLSSLDLPRGQGNYDIAVSGPRLFLASAGGLRIIDVADPASPTLISKFQGRGHWVRGVDVVGATAYLATSMHADASWLQIVNVSDAKELVELGLCQTAGGAQDVAVSKSVAFVADRSNGLLAVDVSDPADPRPCGLYCPAGRVNRVAVGNALVLAEVHGERGESGISIIRYAR